MPRSSVLGKTLLSACEHNLRAISYTSGHVVHIGAPTVTEATRSASEALYHSFCFKVEKTNSLSCSSLRKVLV